MDQIGRMIRMEVSDKYRFNPFVVDAGLCELAEGARTYVKKDGFPFNMEEQRRRSPVSQWDCRSRSQYDDVHFHPPIHRAITLLYRAWRDLFLIGVTSKKGLHKTL